MNGLINEIDEKDVVDFLVGSRIARWYIFQPKMGKFWRALEWKMFVYFKAIWNMLRPFGVHIL
jgi:hypothetical protein